MWAQTNKQFLAWFSKKIECLHVFAYLTSLKLLTLLANFTQIWQMSKHLKDILN